MEIQPNEILTIFKIWTIAMHPSEGYDKLKGNVWIINLTIKKKKKYLNTSRITYRNWLNVFLHICFQWVLVSIYMSFLQKNGNHHMYVSQNHETRSRHIIKIWAICQCHVIHIINVNKHFYFHQYMIIQWKIE